MMGTTTIIVNGCNGAIWLYITMLMGMPLCLPCSGLVCLYERSICQAVSYMLLSGLLWCSGMPLYRYVMDKHVSSIVLVYSSVVVCCCI